MKKFTFLFLLLLIPVLVTAQSVKRTSIHKAPYQVTEQPTSLKANYQPGKTQAAGNYIAVDTSNSGLGPSISTLNPFAYDPYSGTACFAHRNLTATYGAGQTSGQLWYNISTDFGVTWTRVPGGINTTNAQVYGRYPSMGLTNEAKGPIDGTIAFFSWPELTTGGAGFGWAGYAADQPAGAGAPSAFIDEGTVSHQYSSQTVCWANDKAQYMFWAADLGTTAVPAAVGIDLWSTSDFGSVNKVSPPQWSDSVFNSGGEMMLGGQAYNGVQYFGVVGTFNSFYAPNPVAYGWFPGVSKSTDNGATWSDFKVCDWRQIPKLANYDHLYSWSGSTGGVRFDGDINVDKNGHAHLLVGLADTSNNIDSYKGVALVDLFETATGWDATIVADDIDTTVANNWSVATNQAVGQMGPSPYLAFDSTRTIMAVQYNNNQGGKANNCNLFLKYKLVSDANWSSAINLTKSDSLNLTCSHLAPFIKASISGSTASCEVFSAYVYEVGNTGPTGNGNNESAYYFGAEPFTISVNGVNDAANTVNSFALSQNYPNPFNPSTVLNYSLPQRGTVSLKVYDMLGREVVTLVNATQEAGNHSVNFNASKLASGLYVYTLRAGNNVMSKKMMLLK
jgi:hypothetical protein